MRSRYYVREEHRAHFITSTVVEWLPIFTTQRCCDLLVSGLQYCREHKGLRIYAWVIMDNHFHAVVAAPNLAGVMQSLKRYTALSLPGILKEEGRSWLADRLEYYCRNDKRKAGSRYQVWQEGYHPQSIASDDMIAQKRRYIHLKPVRRGLVSLPGHWRYSSAHEMIPVWSR